MYRHQERTIVALLLAALAGCKLTVTPKPSPAPSPAPTPTATPTPPPACGSACEPKTTELEGIWSYCGEWYSSYGALSTLEFRGENVMKAEYTLYQHSACSQDPELKLTAEGTFSIGGAASSVAGAKNIDLIVQKLFVTPMNAKLVADYNDNGSCGFDDWQLNVPHEVTHSVCAGWHGSWFLVSNYNIFRVEGAKLDELYFGDIGHDGVLTNGSAPDRRPTTLLPRPLVKQ